MDIKKLENKVALITGASKGLGAAIAYALADAGAIVIINYKSNTKAAEAVVNTICSKGQKAFAFQADVSDETEVFELFSKIEQQVGTVDILVNNAGINPSKPILEITLEDFQQTINVNLTSAFLTTQAALPAMIKNKSGRIIHISSVAAQLGGVIGSHYAASKAGMIGLTHSYATLVAQYGGITSNAIAPALIETDMIKDNPNIKPTLIPIGRFGQPNEVSDVVLLLASNGYINGQTINVNGGWYMS